MKFFLPIFFATSACSIGQTLSPIKVDKDEYQILDKCWKKNGGSINAFVILSELDKGYIPYFISPFCYSFSEGYDDTINGIPSIAILGDNGIAKKNKLIGKDILSNTTNDQISDNKHIYVFRGNLEKVSVMQNGINAYKISKIDILKKLQYTPEYIGNLDAKKRYQIFDDQTK